MENRVLILRFWKSLKICFFEIQKEGESEISWQKYSLMRRRVLRWVSLEVNRVFTRLSLAIIHILGWLHTRIFKSWGRCKENDDWWIASWRE